MLRGSFYKFNRSFKNLKNVIFHVKLLSLTLKHLKIYEYIDRHMFSFLFCFHKILHVALDLCPLKTDAYFQAHIEECFNLIRPGLFIQFPGSGEGGSEAHMTEIKITIIQLKSSLSRVIIVI